jgi:hypothetical protein
MADGLVEKNDILVGMRQVDTTPLYLEKQLSNTSNALDCFTKQRFSRRLQNFLLSYRTFVTTDFSVTDE